MNVYRVKTGSILPLGKQGENLARKIQFDISRWIGTLGPGTVQLLHQRRGDEAPYPVAVEQEGNLAVWTVTNADTAAAGTGRAELQYYVGDALAKSETWMTKVLAALGDAIETPPEAQQGWVDQVLAQVARITGMTAQAVDLPAGSAPTADYADGVLTIGIPLGGDVSEAQIAQAVAEYLSNNPIAETDPTVPDWAKQPDKPSYTAEEVGALSSETLPEAINTALAQAKESGEFDGAAGQDGAPGQDGITPTIGDNGNWYVGQTDTGVPATGRAGQAATFEIVGTETVEPGQPAAVEETEDSTARARKYKLSVPQGEKGDPGSASFETVDGTDSVVDWTFTDGMPEDNGLTYTGTEGKAVMQSDGLLLSTGAEYKPPVLTASNAAVECVFSSPNFGDYYGFQIQLCDAEGTTNGIRISWYSNELIYFQALNNYLTLADLSVDTEYTLRIEWDATNGATVYLNGEVVLTGGKTAMALNGGNLFRQVSGGGTTLLKSLTYTFPGMGHEIVAIDGKKLRDETARAMAAQGGGAGLTVTNTAAVGQTVKITAVGEDGQPTEWEAVDFSSGGGSNLPTPTAEDAGKVPTVNADGTGYELGTVSGCGTSDWRLIKTIEITEEVASISFDSDDDGNLFEVESLLIYAGLTVKTSENSQFIVSMNNTEYVITSSNSFVGTTAKSIYWETHWAGLRVAVMGSSTYDFKNVASNASTVRLSDASLQKITSVKLMLQGTTTFTAGKFYIYGR